MNDGSGAPVSSKSVANLLLESEAAPYDLNRPNDLFTNPKHINQYLRDSGADDISNHNLQAPGGATQ